MALTQLDPGWGVAASVAFVMAVQGRVGRGEGPRQDVLEIGGQAAARPRATALFRWVAALTGSKNAVKGLGFFLGAALLALAGFEAAVWVMAAVLALILIAVVAVPA